ncbi:MAG: hypothetical protein ACYC8T_25690 [Myxococcaceae bacterium]
MSPGLLAALSFCMLAGAAPQVSVKPTRVVLGRDKGVEVRVSSHGSGNLRAVANVGALREQSGGPKGFQRYFYSPPSDRFPQVAVLLFWVEDGGRPEVKVVRVPLVGRTELEATSEPGATVRVEVAKAIFGPVKADSRGRVAVPIEVPPGTTVATVLAEFRGLSTSRVVPLGVPRANPLTAILTPDKVAADGEGFLVVAHAASFDPAGLEVRVEGGRAERVAADSDRVLYRVVPERGAGQLRAKVSLRGDPEARAFAESEVLGEVPGGPGTRRRPEVGASAGYFWAGGANAGLAVALGAGYPLPAASGRLTLEAAVGFRSWSLSAGTVLGGLRSAVLALPVEAGLRVTVLERGAATLSGKVGAGLLPFRHSATPPAGRSFVETGLGYEAYASLQGGFRAGPVELFAELRGTIAPVRTARLDADAGGLALLGGARFPLP